MVILKPLEIYNGIFKTIFISISIIIGLKIALKYLKYKQRIFLVVGIAVIGFAGSWIVEVISFYYTLLTLNVLPIALFILIGYVFFPISILCWYLGMIALVFKEKKKIIIAIILIWIVCYEILFIPSLIINPYFLGDLKSPIYFEPGIIFSIFLFSAIFILYISAIFFIRKSLISNKVDIKFKGIFLLIAFTLYAVGAIFDMLSRGDFIFLTITHLILIFSSIFTYFGFILPEILKKFLIKSHLARSFE